MRKKIIVLIFIIFLCVSPFIQTVLAITNEEDLFWKLDNNQVNEELSKVESLEDKVDEVLDYREIENEEESKIDATVNEADAEEEKNSETIEENNLEKSNEKKAYPDSIKAKNILVSVQGRGNPNEVLNQEQRNFAHSSLETTGIYLPRGEELVIYVEEDPGNLAVVIGLHGEYDTEKFDLDGKSQGMTRTTLVQGENRISKPSGAGLVYLENRTEDELIDVKLDGGVKIPSFTLGETTRESFIEQIESYSPYVPFFEFSGEYTLAAFQTSELKHLQYKDEGRLESLVSYWDEVIIETNELYGFNNDAGGAAKKNVRQRIYIATPDTGAGYAYATSGFISFQLDTGAAKDLLAILPSVQQWGLWHEVGHTYQNKNYTFANHTEVSVNLSPSAIYKKLLDGDRTADVKVTAAVKNYFSQPIETRNYEDITDGSVQLAMYWSLQRVFGETFYPRINQFYRTMDSSQLPKTNDEKYQMFIKATSEVVNRDLTQYFREWGIPVDEETKEYCSQFLPLEKEIWKDISGGSERFELLDILGEYTIPKSTPYTVPTPIFSSKNSILATNFNSVPFDSETSIMGTSYTDIEDNGGSIKLINKEGVRNKLTITTITGGDAIRLFGNSSGIKVMAPNPETQKFQVTGKSGKFHGTWSSDLLYASVKQYSPQGEVKREVNIYGTTNSDEIGEIFNNQTYEIGDFIEVYHAESHTRMSRYKENTMLEKDANKYYWYKMTVNGWEEVNVDPTGTFSDNQKVSLTNSIKAEDVVKDVKGFFPVSEVDIRFEKEPDLLEVGKKTVTVVINDSLAGQMKLTGSIEVIGGDAVRLYGNDAGLKIIAPNPETQKFQVTGKSGKFHASWTANLLYASIKHFSEEGEIKREANIFGTENSNEIETIFNNQPYEIGDVVEIYHAESQSRLNRYKDSIPFEKDNNKYYRYKMTNAGWEEVIAIPSGSFVDNLKFTLAGSIKPEDVVKDVKGFFPRSEIKIRFEKIPDLVEIGEKEVTVIVEDSLSGQIKLSGTIEVVGGDAVHLFGNSSGFQIIAPNTETQKFQVVGKSGRFHGTWDSKLLYASVKQYSRQGDLKKEVLIYGATNSNEIETMFNNQPYEIGDVIEIHHAESHTRLNRYKDSVLVEKDKNKYYRYEMTSKGWEALDVSSEFEFSFDGDAENATATVTKYNGSKTDIEIPSVAINFAEGWFKEMPVVAIADDAFKSSKFISVNIPGSIKKIGTGAFRQSNVLATIYLNEGLEEIGSSAFDNTKVSDVTFPKSLKIIATGAFTAANLSEITIPENVEEIGKNAFRSNGTLGKFTILSDKVTYGETIFANSYVGLIYAPREKLEKIKDQLATTVMDTMLDKKTYLRTIEDYKEDARILEKNEKEKLTLEVTDEYRLDTKYNWVLDTPDQQINWYKDNKLVENGVGLSSFTIQEMTKSDTGIYYAERVERKLESIYLTVGQGGITLPPLDPTNEEEESVKPEEMNPHEGKLSILFISPLKFNISKHKNKEQIIYGTTEDNSTPKISLQDFRPDIERVGWELYVRQTSNFVDGATLQMSPYIHETYKENLKLNISSEILVLGTENQQFAKTVAADPPSGVVTMGMSQPNEQGVKLTIPKGSGLGTYKTNIVWELVSSP